MDSLLTMAAPPIYQPVNGHGGGGRADQQLGALSPDLFANASGSTSSTPRPGAVVATVNGGLQPASNETEDGGPVTTAHAAHNPESLTRLAWELADKQRLIARLSHDVDTHRAALHRLSEEVVDVRQRNENMAARNQALQARVDSHTDNIVMDPRALFDADRATVLHAQVKLLQRRRLYQTRREEAKHRVSYLQNEVIKKNELEMKVAKLCQAQSAQDAFVKNLKVRL